MTPPTPCSEAVAAAQERCTQRYWAQSNRWTLGLLALWFVVTFVFTYHARVLNFVFFGWPFSFWMAAQGALLIYLLIVWVYARVMNDLDQTHAAQLDDD